MLDKNKARFLYVNELEARGFSEKTIKLKKQLVAEFLESIRNRDVREINRNQVRDYFLDLEVIISVQTGRKLTVATKRIKKRAVKDFFQFLYVNDRLLNNPAADLKINKVEKTLPRESFSQEEMANFLDLFDWRDEVGLRDRALFELLYSTGLRIGEALKLKALDLDLKNRLVFIRKGKGGKDRIEPLNHTSVKFLTLYMKNHEKKKDQFIFLSHRKGPLTWSVAYKKFKKNLENLGLKGRKLSPHSIRHSTATHLLENGMGIRYVQELLGHSSLESTVIYTHLRKEELRKTYKSFHPRENQFSKEMDITYQQKVSELKQRLLLQKEKRNKKS